MVTLHPIKYDKAKLAAVPDDERVLHFMMQQIANDVSMLHKLLIFYLQAPNDELAPVRAARTAMALMLAQLLAGRLYEAWNLLRGPAHSKVYQAYASKLSDEANNALEQIKRYFNGADNLIGKIRNKLVFHTDIDAIRAGYNSFPESEKFTDFIADNVGNTFYQGASVLMSVALKQLAGENDLATALNKFMEDVRVVGHWVVDYVQGFMVEFVLRYVDPLWSDVKSAAIKIPSPRLVEIHAPFFCEAAATDLQDDQ